MLNATLLLTLATLGGLALGFLREWLLIDIWGAGQHTDAFVLALFLPDTLRITLAAGLLSVAAIPLFHQQHDAEKASWLNGLGTFLLVLAVVLSVLFYWLADWWVWATGPGLNVDTRNLAIQAFTVLVWCIPGLFIQAVCSVWLQVQQRYVLAGLGGFLFNLFPVAWLWLAGDRLTVDNLAFACVLGSVSMALVVMPSAWQAGWRPFVWRGAMAASGQFFQRLGPVLLSNLGSHGSVLAERAVASLLGEGMITWVNLARKLVNLPLVALMALNQVLLSQLSARQATERLGLLQQGLSLTSCLTLPAAVGLLAISPTLVMLLFPEVHETGVLTALLAWFCVPLLFGAWNAMLARYAYANNDTRLPLLCELSGTAVHVVLLLLLPLWFGIAGFALANLAAVLVTGVLLLRKQELWWAVRWRSQWGFGVIALISVAMFIYPLPAGWQQAGYAVAAGALCLMLCLYLYRPWKPAVPVKDTGVGL